MSLKKLWRKFFPYKENMFYRKVKYDQDDYADKSCGFIATFRKIDFKGKDLLEREYVKATNFGEPFSSYKEYQEKLSILREEDQENENIALIKVSFYDKQIFEGLTSTIAQLTSTKVVTTH